MTNDEGAERIEIRLLSECPDFLGTIVRWVSEEWEATTEEELGARVLGNVGCPPTLVAVLGEEVVGVIAFTRTGTDGRELDGLWVNILYVEETKRGEGTGKRLLAEGVEAARRSGAEWLFALTDAVTFYGALGWGCEADEGEGNNGSKSRVMKLIL